MKAWATAGAAIRIFITKSPASRATRRRERKAAFQPFTLARGVPTAVRNSHKNGSGDRDCLDHTSFQKRITGRSHSKQHGEGIMISDWKTQVQAISSAAILTVALGAIPAPQAVAATPDMVNYTNYPMFLNKTGPVNILFLVDFSNATLEAAF